MNEAEVASVAQAVQAQARSSPYRVSCRPGRIGTRLERLKRRTAQRRTAQRRTAQRRTAQAPDDSGRGAPNPPAISCSRIFLRPRCSRDITVPTGVPMISAISRYG
jgi:hypothetical protein